MTIGKLGKSFLVCALLVGALLVTGAFAESKARIVRLSSVEGTVQMDRGNGFEKAFLNLPIVEGSRIKTGSDGRAEVEFEDGTILHLATKSEIGFPHLTLGDEGQKRSTVELKDGRLYVNARPKKGDQLTVNFARESTTISDAARLRIDLEEAEATVAVFQGDVEVNGPSGKVALEKKRSATFDLANNDSYAIAKNFEEEPSDAWDKQQTEYHDRYASNKTYDASSPYSYGISDLNYYGSYSNIPGYGWGWQPFFMGAGWSPYQDGAWAWYPGVGYMWVSAYPWGWMPYYYGSWQFAPGYGWFWSPGYWNTWYPTPRVVNPPNRTPVPQPPTRTGQTVMVGRGLTSFPATNVPRRMTINPGSAGLGIPRGSVRNLDRTARESVKRDAPVVVRTSPPAPVNAPAPSWGSYGTSGGSPSMRGPSSTGARPSAPARMPSSGRSSNPH